MAEVAIYTLIDLENLGQLGPDSRIVYREPCSDCGRPYRRRVEYLELQMDGWEGSELFQGDSEFVATEALASAMDEAGIVGCRFQDMRVVRGENWELMDPDHQLEMPSVRHMVIEATVDGPSGWWQLVRRCATCRRSVWEHTTKVSEGLAAGLTGRVAAPRQVFRSSWSGQDVFYSDDPGPPLITQKFKDVLDRFYVGELTLNPAEFVS